MSRAILLKKDYSNTYDIVEVEGETLNILCWFLIDDVDIDEVDDYVSWCTSSKKEKQGNLSLVRKTVDGNIAIGLLEEVFGGLDECITTPKAFLDLLYRWKEALLVHSKKIVVLQEGAQVDIVFENNVVIK